MTEELKPCPFCGGPARFADAVAKYIVCQQCGTFGATGESDNDAAVKWNTRAESEVYGNGWAVKTKWNSVPHIFRDQREAERFAYDEKAEVVRVKIVRDE